MVVVAVGFFTSGNGMTPHEALYERKCKTLLCWYQNGETVGWARINSTDHWEGEAYV